MYHVLSDIYSCHMQKAANLYDISPLHSIIYYCNVV